MVGCFTCSIRLIFFIRLRLFLRSITAVVSALTSLNFTMLQCHNVTIFHDVLDNKVTQ
jgi:hypothetical protein